MKWQGPLAKSYPAAVALVVLALVPFLMLSAAITPLAGELGKQLSMSTKAFDLVTGLAYAAYAAGTVIAVQLAQHLPQRRMLLGYVSLFVVAAIVCASATNEWAFSVAFITEGLCTSLMLIAAVPPLVIGWPPKKMPWTGMVMNLCVFGAVAAGPTIGNLQLSNGDWRPLFWVVAGIGAAALVFSLLTFEDQPAQDKEAPWDWVALALATVGCTAAFFGAGELDALKTTAAVAIAPLAGGVALIVALVIFQYRVKRPLMPVKQVATTLPVVGIVVAMFASAAAFGLMDLVLTALQKTSGPTHTALLFLPEFGAAVATAGLFALLFRTRFTPVMAMGGLVPLAVAAAVLTGIAGGGGTVVLAGSGLIGLGVGSSVSPALFIAGFSLKSAQIQRVFALIELLRGVTAFLVAPILLFLVTSISTSPAVGLRDAMWICAALALVGGALAVTLFMTGSGRLQVPDLETWQKGEPAWESPPLLANAHPRGRHFRTATGNTAVPS